MCAALQKWPVLNGQRHPSNACLYEQQRKSCAVESVSTASSSTACLHRPTVKHSADDEEHVCVREELLDSERWMLLCPRGCSWKRRKRERRFWALDGKQNSCFMSKVPSIFTESVRAVRERDVTHTHTHTRSSEKSVYSHWLNVAWWDCDLHTCAYLTKLISLTNDIYGCINILWSYQAVSSV